MCYLYFKVLLWLLFVQNKMANFTWQSWSGLRKIFFYLLTKFFALRIERVKVSCEQCTNSQSWGTWLILAFSIMKKIIFAFFTKWVWLDVCYFNMPRNSLYLRSAWPGSNFCSYTAERQTPNSQLCTSPIVHTTLWRRKAVIMMMMMHTADSVLFFFVSANRAMCWKVHSSTTWPKNVLQFQFSSHVQPLIADINTYCTLVVLTGWFSMSDEYAQIANMNMHRTDQFAN